MSITHEALVASQFGPRARAYLESPDHANGADLDRLASLVAAKPGGRVLDLGCGGGHVSFAVASFSVDMLSAVCGEAARRGFAQIRTEQGAAEALPFPDADFDFVLTRFSAHHWDDLAAGLHEIRRVLKPSGTAVVVDTVSPGTPALHDTFLQTIELLRDPSHVRDYSVAEWLEALQTAGLHPAVPITSRLRLDFARWVARIGTPDVQVNAIRTLQEKAPVEIVERYEIEADGSFKLDTALIEAGL